MGYHLPGHLSPVAHYAKHSWRVPCAFAWLWRAYTLKREGDAGGPPISLPPTYYNPVMCCS